jgi:hypothetical protein
MGDSVDDKTFEEGKLAAILSYWFWPAAYFLKGENPFAKYHAKQGLAYFIFALVVWAAMVGMMILWSVVLAPAVGVFLMFAFITIKGTLNVLEKKQVPPPILEKVPFLGEIVKKVGTPA